MIVTPDEVQTRLRKRPFAPLRIVTTTGATYDIYHPNMVMVARRFHIIGTPSADNPTLADTVARVALVHVEELRDLSPPPSAPSQGTAQEGS